MSKTVSRETLARISDALSRQMALRFPEKRWKDLERGLLVACRDMNLAGPEECLEALEVSKLSQEQVERLASHLTIGETYFFREPRSFEALEKRILPELIERRRESTRILRFWSAGCSSGEEAYSVAILLQRLIPDWEDWNITILATDINPAVLRKAESGIYRNWSFRGLDDSFKKRYFNPVDSNRFQIKSFVQKMVNFAYLNLADESAYPSLATNTLAMDVIFCRNVLMYFARDWILKVTGCFQDALTDGGWVVTSPSEASTQYFPGFSVVNFPGAIFFRKSPVHASRPRFAIERVEHKEKETVEKAAGPARESAVAVDESTPEISPGAIRQLLEAGDHKAVISQLDFESAGLEELNLLALAWANDGDLRKALSCCEKALMIDRFALRCHYLKAAVLQEMGENEEAAKVLRKTLFLQPDFAMGHFSLGNICRTQGKRGMARRHFRRAEVILEKLAPDATLEEGEGMTVEQLRQIVAANLRSLT